MVSELLAGSNWQQALAGGALIGGASLLLYATLGRIAGVSGIAFGTLSSFGTERLWRIVFLIGLGLGGWVALAIGSANAPAVGGAGVVPVALAIVSGLLVGYGTRLGNGCTSGHGVCGLARLSPRSLWAVLVFMGLGMATATLLRPLLISSP